MTDVELDARITALEENGGGRYSLNGKTNVFLNIMQQSYTVAHPGFVKWVPPL